MREHDRAVGIAQTTRRALTVKVASVPLSTRAHSTSTPPAHSVACTAKPACDQPFEPVRAVIDADSFVTIVCSPSGQVSTAPSPASLAWPARDEK